ncbi:MAG TPA: cbb3-type cytochrome c oxidase subunit I [Gemmatimonadaceae bacterium]|nr:cbb3-type cytochrome c oxidase subunit I [Gemmatimonadaceae bacterium]
MHSLVRRYIKTAVLFLLAGLALGAWMVVRRELHGSPPGAYVVSAHTHLIFVGFVMMMILGVALWLFPRPEKGDERYRPAVANAAYWMLTVGTAVRAVGELLRAGSTAHWLRWSVVVASLLQVVGLVTFFYTIWSRIRAVGSAVREARGERF